MPQVVTCDHTVLVPLLPSPHSIPSVSLSLPSVPSSSPSLLNCGKELEGRTMIPSSPTYTQVTLATPSPNSPFSPYHLSSPSRRGGRACWSRFMGQPDGEWQCYEETMVQSVRCEGPCCHLPPYPGRSLVLVHPSAPPLPKNMALVLYIFFVVGAVEVCLLSVMT